MKSTILRTKNNQLIKISRSEGSYVDGEYQVSNKIDFTIKGNVQPASGYQVLNLPEGKRDRKAFNIFTKENTCKNTDKITIDNEVLEIINIKKFGNHCEIFCVGVPKNAI